MGWWCGCNFGGGCVFLYPFWFGGLLCWSVNVFVGVVLGFGVVWVLFWFCGWGCVLLFGFVRVRFGMLTGIGRSWGCVCVWLFFGVLFGLGVGRFMGVCLFWGRFFHSVCVLWVGLDFLYDGFFSIRFCVRIWYWWSGYFVLTFGFDLGWFYFGGLR